MSQNKTVIPESEYDLQHPTYSDMGSSSDFYRPSGTARNSTVIAGSGNGTTPPPVPTHTNPSPTNSSADDRRHRIPLQERVIIGVLFSISKGLLGEIFPIYLGRNMLGSSPSCDICLKEKTVSDEHAVLHARCNGYPGECFLSITDYGSEHGTSVSDKDGRYETLTVKEGDILTIGKHYRLSVKLFDVMRSGLYEDIGFEEADTGAVTGPTQYQTSNNFYSPSQSSGNDNRTVIG